MVRQKSRDVPVLKDAKLFDYKLKFAGAEIFLPDSITTYLSTATSPYTGSLPIQLNGGDAFNALLKATVVDLFEDIRFTGALRLPLYSAAAAGTSVASGQTDGTPAHRRVSSQAMAPSLTAAANGMAGSITSRRRTDFLAYLLPGGRR